MNASIQFGDATGLERQSVGMFRFFERCLLGSELRNLIQLRELAELAKQRDDARRELRDRKNGSTRSRPNMPRSDRALAGGNIGHRLAVMKTS